MPKFKQVICKSLVELRKICEDWLSTCNESEVHIAAIANSLQQISSCQKAKLENTPLQHKFPDIKSSLIVKLIINSERAFQKLKEILKKLKKYLIEVEDITEKLHEAISPILSLEELYIWSSCEPSSIDIVLWINSIHFTMNQDYAEKLDIIEQLSVMFSKLDGSVDCESVKKIKSLWNNNRQISNLTDEMFQFCFHLLPSK